MGQHRIIPVITVVAAVTAAATACSSSGATTSTGAAGGSGGAAGDAAPAMTLLAKMTAPQAVAASTKAVASKQSAKVHLTVTSPAVSETADGAVSFGASPAMDLTLQMSFSGTKTGSPLAQVGKIEVRMIDLVSYADMGNSPQLAAAMQGKRWMKIDFEHLDGVPGLSSFSFMKDMGKNNDPSLKLKALLASPNLKKVGQEQRDGVQALHFSGSVAANDLLKAVVGAGLSQQDKDSLNATAKQAGVTNADYDVWVDGNGLPVEIKFSEDTGAGIVTGDVVYSDWGTPVSVTAPPADQVVDLAQELKAEQAKQG